MERYVPRLRVKYDQQVRAQLQEQFGYTNVMMIPKLEKLVVNTSMKEAIQNVKLLETAADELTLIVGQKAVITRSRKSIANFKLREGMPIGARVTLRGARMWEFLDRLINVSIPRIRDFRGLSTRSFDGRGNYTMGVKEQLIFPEIDYDKIEKLHGMDLTIVTSTDRDDEGLALLRELGMPFRGATPVAVNA